MDCESPVVDLDVALLDQCLAVNVRGPLLLCKYALPSMVAKGEGGSIYCVTSGAARNYREGRVGYSMSKAALERMFFSLAEEVRPHNIAVNVFEPGRVDTWMNRRGDWPGHRPYTHGATRRADRAGRLARRPDRRNPDRRPGGKSRVRSNLGGRSSWNRSHNPPCYNARRFSCAANGAANGD